MKGRQAGDLVLRLLQDLRMSFGLKYCTQYSKHHVSAYCFLSSSKRKVECEGSETGATSLLSLDRRQRGPPAVARGGLHWLVGADASVVESLPHMRQAPGSILSPQNKKQLKMWGLQGGYW